MATVPALPWGLNAIVGRRVQRQNARLRAALQGRAVRLVDLYGRGKLARTSRSRLPAARSSVRSGLPGSHI
jgi:hypothetical protein